MTCETSMETEPLLPFPPGSRTAVFLKREKRFKVFVETENGPLLVHCNNSGSMLGLLRPGTEVFLSPALKIGRKTAFTVEMVKVHGFWVGVNTLAPNRMLHRAWRSSRLPEAKGYDRFRSEAAVGDSRIDGVFTGPCGRLWVEAKNVTLVEDDTAAFPDAVTVRGQKHLRELIRLARQGDRVAVFYLVQRPDGRCFGPADYIDASFADLFWEALAEGVEVWPYRAVLSVRGVDLGPRIRLAPDRRDGKEQPKAK